MKIMTGFEEDNITEFSQTDRMIGEEIFDTIYEVANESSSNCKPSER